MEKATRHHTKDHNSRLVLRTVYDAGAISRAEIARRTGLTRPTVSSLVADLIDSDVLVETGQGPSAGGKRPTLVTINGNGRCLLALDVSGEIYRGALINLHGTIIHRSAVAVSGLRGDPALEAVFQLADELLPASALLGIGVATPGLVDPQNGIVLRAVNRGWVNLPLRELLVERYRLPVHVANDSHMAALAEYTYGTIHNGHNLIVIRVGEGIGAGVILNGQPFYGDGYGAGEIGHVVVAPSGALCRCGNRGCLEMTSSLPSFLAQARAADRRQSVLGSVEDITWDLFVEAVLAHDPVATDIAVRAGCHLGAAVAQLVGAYNIQTIVLAGSITDLGDILLDAVAAEMHQRVLPAMAAMTTIRYASLGEERLADMINLGCSALVMQRELGIL